MKRRKYGNIKVVSDVMKFDSKKECARYNALVSLESVGLVRNIELQPKYNFYLNGKWEFSYSADFRYESQIDHPDKWVIIIEDVKSKATQKNSTYRLKKRIIQNEYNIKITEVM